MTDPSRTRVSLGSFWGELPTAGRWLLSTVAIQTLGRGLTLPFTIIYLSEVRGIPLGLSGTLMSLVFVAALAVTTPGGSLVDRYGARVMVIASTLSMIAGCTIMAFAAVPVVVAVACVLMGASNGISWPAFNALVASVVTGETRVHYFGVNFALINLGIGLGGAVGGFYVDVARPETFTVIFLANAVTMLVPLVLLLGPLRRLHGRAQAPTDGRAPEPVSYLRIIRRPAVAWITALTFIGCFVGYGQMEAGVPAFARTVGEVSTRTVGLAFAANTVVIVALQFAVLRWITGRRRTRVIVVMALLWGLAWVVFSGSGLVPGTLGAEAFVLAFGVVFAVGETMLQPTIPAMTNDLAPDHARGRYNALTSVAYQGGAITGPIVAGLLLGHEMPALYVAVLVGGCLTLAVFALALERTVSPEANGERPPRGPGGAAATAPTTEAAPAPYSRADSRRASRASGPSPRRVRVRRPRAVSPLRADSPLG